MNQAKAPKIRKINKKIRVFPVTLTLFILSSSFSIFPLDLPEPQSSINISGIVDQTKIPLNRILTLKVTLSWIGDPGIFTILNFNDPVLTNLEITGTSTSSRTEAVDQGIRVIREYEYLLKPEGLGMAYIESVSVKVHNNRDETDEILQTRRIPVEVVEPVPEKEKKGNWILLFIILILTPASAIIILIYLRQKKNQQMSLSQEIQEPTEIHYLNELRNTCDPDNLDLQKDFPTLSQLLRRFLTEKFKIRAMEATTNELVAELRSTEMHENQIQSINEILSRTDEIKFSGTKGNREEFIRFYTLIEGMLETFLRKPEKKTQQSDKNQGEEIQ